MEIIIPFKKSQFTKDGVRITDNKFILELQQDWENDFHNKFMPYYANVIEGHPKSMRRLTNYLEYDDTEYDFGMELIEGEIDLDTNLAIEKFSKVKTIYAIGSQFHTDEDNPLFLIKNENLSEDILLLKFIDEDSDNDSLNNIPVNVGFEISSN